MQPNVLFRERFEPVVSIDDAVLLLGTSAPRIGQRGGTGLVRVTHVEAIPLLGQHGIIVLWTQTGTAPDGYALDEKATSGTIAPGGSKVIPPQALTFAPGQFAQLRYRVKMFAPVTGSVSDYDVRVNSPGAASRWMFQGARGVLNAIQQAPDPADAQLAPAAGADASVPTQRGAVSPWLFAAPSELFTLEDQGPSFELVNNGAAGTAGGAMGIEVRGFVYNYEVLMSTSPTRTVRKAGFDISVPVDLNPDDIVCLPVAYRAPS